MNFQRTGNLQKSVTQRKGIVSLDRLFLAVIITFLACAFCPAGAFGSSQSERIDSYPTQDTESASLSGQDPNSSPFTLNEEERDWLRAHPVISIAIDPDWAPVEFTDSHGEAAGISQDYLKIIEWKLGVTFKRVTDLSWAESYPLSRRWEIDMTLAVTVTPEREAFWAFTRPYMKMPLVIFAQSDVTFISGVRELAGKTVAVVEGYAAGEWIQKDFPQVKLLKVKNVQAGLELLQKGQVFAFIDNMLVGSYHLVKQKLTNIKIAGETPYVSSVSIAVRKDWAILAGILQKALDSISETERERIYQKWVPVQYERGFNYTIVWQALAAFSAIVLFLLFWNRRLSREIRYRKNAEAALSESEMRMRDILNNVGANVFMKDSQYRFTYVNNKVCDLLGREEQDILGRTSDDFFSPKSVEIRQSDRQVIENGESVHCEGKDLFQTEMFDCEYWIVKIPLRDRAGKIYGLCGIATDISELIRAQQALRESEEQYRNLIMYSPDAIFVNHNDSIILLNNACLKLFGARTMEELLGKSPYKLFHPGDHERIRERIHRLRDLGEPVSLAEERIVRLDGEIVDVEVLAAPFQIGGTNAIHVILRDITERKRTEEAKEKLEAQLVQAQKMESVGRLAGGVAHDFNNMLGVIIGHAEMALDEVDPAQTVYRDLQEILKAAQRSADLTRRLLAFARRQAIAPKVLDLNETVGGMLQMLQRLIGEDIDLMWKPCPELLPIEADPSQIDQVLANLCVNARDAIGGVGKVTIETDCLSLDDNFCREHAGLIPGDYVLLAVSDNGSGMDTHVLEHLFEPFFTTKEPGRGTGLGLATVYGIVQQNKGVINVYSEPGHGTTFKIWFPRASAGRAGGQLGQNERADLRGTETILLVEDEKSILAMARTILEQNGYTVLPARNPAEALSLYQSHQGTIHLLITDVVMPGMNGKDLNEKLKAWNPELKCLFMSGYTENVIAHQGILDDGIHFLQKPFSVKALAEKVREVLNS